MATINELTLHAEQGNAQAQNNLGLCYMLGDGVDIDEKEAAFWFIKAAEQDEPPAIANLSRCYLQGVGIKKDLSTAP